MSCEKHATEIPGYSLEELAIKLGDLRYDQLSDFLQLLATKLFSDAEADRQRARLYLFDSLNRAGSALLYSHRAVEYAWKLSKPHMDIKQDNV